MSVGQRDGASGPELHLHIGRVVVEPALLDGIGPNRAKCAKQIQAALRRRSGAESMPSELLTAADKVAHAIWAQVNPIVEGARHMGMRSSAITPDAVLHVTALGNTPPVQVGSPHIEHCSKPQRVGEKVTHGTGKDVNI